MFLMITMTIKVTIYSNLFFCSDKPHLKGKLERYISTKLPPKVGIRIILKIKKLSFVININ